MPYIAPNSPVADWRCVPQGHGYGNYFDPVTGTWATVTRTTPKTARVAADKLVDVPAGYLALEPWSLHKTGGVGLAAIIEEVRTNYLLNSYFAADTNADGLADDWSVSKTVSGTPTVSRTSGIYGPFAQNVYYESASDSGKVVGLQAAMTAVGSFAAGDAATLSFYARSDGSEAGFTAYLLARDAAGAALGVVSLSLSLTSEWSRYSLTYATLPAGTSRCIVQLFATGVDTGDIVDFTIDACQLEKGSFATSYIPTTTAAVTRNADVVTVPTTGWNAATGTMVAVSRNLGTVQTRRIFAWENAAGGQALNLQCDAPVDARFIAQYADGTYLRAIRAPSANSAFVIAGRFVNGDTNVDCFVDGAKATIHNETAASYTTLSAPSALAGIGNNANGDRPSIAVVARAIVYDTALTDAQLAAADMTTGLLAGLDTARITNEVTL